MDFDEKGKEIKRLEKEQKRLLNKVMKIAKSPASKKAGAEIKKAFNVVNYLIQAKAIEAQKNIVISQPAPKFPKGGISIVSNIDKFTSKKKK